MKVRLLALMLLLVSAVPALGQAKNTYVGYKYKAVIPETILGNGWKSLGGALVGDFTKDPVWGISRVSKGRTQMLWLEKSISKDEEGSVAEWEVVDALTFANFPAGNDLLFGGGPMPCNEKGKLAEDLVVYVQFVNRSQTYRTIRAWRPDINAGKFIPVNARSVKCIFEAP